MLWLGPYVSADGIGDFSCGAGSCLLRFLGAVSARLGTLGLSFYFHVILDVLLGFRVDPVLVGQHVTEPPWIRGLSSIALRVHLAFHSIVLRKDAWNDIHLVEFVETWVVP